MKKLLALFLFIPTFAMAATSVPLQRTGTTESLLYSGDSFQIQSLGTVGSPCITVDTNGLFSTKTCGSGGGGSGGTWSTTTSLVTNQLINYPNNTTDIPCIGSTATTTCKYWFDPNALISFLAGKTGHGTTSPSDVLSVVGNEYLTGNLRVSNITATGTLTISGNTSLAAATSTNFAITNTTNTLLKTASNGAVVPALSGTDYQAAGTYVTSISIASSNGFGGSSSGGATPALTLTTSINGILKGNGTAVSAAANGTDYSLITANTCSAGQHFNQATAAGVFSCTADSGSGSGGTGNVSTSTTPTRGNLAFWSTSGSTPELLGSVATSSASCSGNISCSAFTVVGSVSPTISFTGTLPVTNGGTGQTAFAQGWLGVNDTGAIISSTSPTVSYIDGTSTTIFSTFPRLRATSVLDVSSGIITLGSLTGFLTASAGIVSANNPPTNTLITWNGSSVVSTSSPTIGIITATSTTATSTFANGINVTGGCIQYLNECISQEQNYKTAVEWATAGALPANTYLNGTAGRGATLTGVSIGALTIDGNAVTNGDRVLIKNEAATANNGIYVVTNPGSGIVVYVLTRASDFDQAIDINPGDTVFVVAGSTLLNTSWAETSFVSTMGTDPITFAQVANGAANVSSVSNSDNTLTISPTTGAVIASLKLSNPNKWTGLQSFYGNASSSIQSVFGPLYVGGTATTTINGNTGTSTFSNNILVTNFASTSQLSVSGSATSSFTSGINIKTGCYAFAGTCIAGGGGGGSGTVTSIIAGTNITITEGTPCTVTCTINSSGGGTNFFSNSGSNTFLSTGSVLGFPSFNSTSTSATSTIQGPFVLATTTAITAEYRYGDNGGAPCNIATSTSMSINWGCGNQQLINIGTSAVTLNMTNYVAGQSLRLIVCNPRSTAGTITWDTNITWGGSGAAVPGQTTSANNCDVWSFIATNASSTASTGIAVTKIFGFGMTPGF